MKTKFGQRLKYILYLLIVTIICVELCPYLVSPTMYSESFSREGLKEEIATRYQNLQKENGKEDAEEEGGYLGSHILHPYLGFVKAPSKSINQFCFDGPDPITKKSEDQINICLMGGSVAMGVYDYSREEITRKLQESGLFGNKKIEIVLLALGGYKQPQQLMALNYFLALGAEYDIIINLDGFNEIVLPYSDNLEFNVFSSYPRHWNFYSKKKLDSKVQLLLSKELGLSEKQKNLDKLFVEKHFNQSNFGLLLWNILKRKNERLASSIESQLRDAVKNSGSDYQSTGPKQMVSDTTQFFKDQAKFWKRSSLIMNGISKSMECKYFHFLQPNQYVENSKKLTENELSIAYEHTTFSYKTAVQKGYPFLISEGEGLIAQGVNYYDLTLIFKDEKASVYNDKCCHFNDYGYDVIANEMSDRIINQLKKSAEQ